jgi:putative toxin-antitoxin system antitoxin component (TIGR02293 family)
MQAIKEITVKAKKKVAGRSKRRNTDTKPDKIANTGVPDKVKTGTGKPDKVKTGKAPEKSYAQRTIESEPHMWYKVEDEDGMHFRRRTVVLLPGTASKPESQMTAFEKMNMIREGVSKKDLEYFKQQAELDYGQLAGTFSVARATLINKKTAEKFNQTLSEKIVSLADIYSYGYEVFGDRDRFNKWIFRANRALGGQPPYALLDNQYGREEVRSVIGRIDYGVYS